MQDQIYSQTLQVAFKRRNRRMWMNDVTHSGLQYKQGKQNYCLLCVPQLSYKGKPIPVTGHGGP
jgi:hypothetical protein